MSSKFHVTATEKSGEAQMEFAGVIDEDVDFTQIKLPECKVYTFNFAGVKGINSCGIREWVHFSQGERQRVLIARALMARPRLLILDEPCAGLDPVAREHFLGFVDRLARRRGAPALVLVTHHVEEITPAFTHALLLRGGRVVAAGPRAQLLTSARLSAALGAPLKLIRAGRRYRLGFARPPAVSPSNP